MAERFQILKEIDEVSFCLNDLNLYLDTHPTDEAALEAFHDALKRRKLLLDAFAAEFEPLTVDTACPGSTNQSQSCSKYGGTPHFTWNDGPLPWEGGVL